MESIMGKNEFLSELEKSLSVLQEDELRDIISEYEQHIDIKVEKGLTEEEVIADFGSLSELTGEILEAYHVRVDYATGGGKSRKRPAKVLGQESSENLQKLREMGGKGGTTLWSGVKGAGAWVVRTIVWVWRQACRPFIWLRSQAAFQSPDSEGCETGEETVKRLPGLEADPTGQDTETAAQRGGNASHRTGEDAKMSRDMQRRRRTGSMTGNAVIIGGRGFVGRGFHSLCRGIRKMIKWTADIALWGIRLMWNGCWIMFSVLTAGFGLFSLFAMGLLAVLLTQGYPLAGVTIGCAGLVCCMFSAAGLGTTFLWRRRAGKAGASKRFPEENALNESEKAGQESIRRRIHRPERVMKAKRREASAGPEEFAIQQREGDGQDA